MKPLASFVSSLVLFANGQALLLVLAERTRASGAFVTRQGLALLAPDSNYYLGLSASLETVLEAPWTRWGYPLLLLLGDRLGSATTFIVILQSAVAILVGVALQATVARTAGPVGGLVAGAAFLVNPLTAQWVRFVLTDFLFFSLVLTAVLLTLRYSTEARHLQATGAIGAALAAVGATMLRPNGVLVLGATAVCIVALRAKQRRRATRGALQAAVWVLTGSLLMVAAEASGPPAEGSTASQLYDGVVIEGTEATRFTITMPVAADPEDESMRAAALYAARHPLPTLGLALARIAAEIAQVRPHYSRFTNLAVTLVILPYLLLIAIGLSDPRAAELRRICLTFAVPLLLLIGATFAVPEARYGWAPLLALAPLAGVGAARSQRWLALPTSLNNRRERDMR